MALIDKLRHRQTTGGAATVELFSEAHANESRRAEAWLSDRIAKSAALPDDELFSEVALVTPVMAEAMLRRNRNNRHLREKRVDAWATSIKEGRWKTTSQGVSFSRDGMLNNGQHRLHAIVKAGRAVRMNVTFGEDHGVFDVLDTGVIRGGADTLHVAGYKNTVLLSATMRLILIVTSSAPRGNTSYTNDVIAEAIRSHPRLEDMTTVGMRVGKRLKTSNTSVTAALYLINEMSSNARRFDSFVQALTEGVADKPRDPIIMLRDGLGQNDGVLLPLKHRGTNRNAMIAASVIKAWNLWLRGKTASRKTLSWQHPEPFPKPE